jgi:hypothetical protein
MMLKPRLFGKSRDFGPCRLPIFEARLTNIDRASNEVNLYKPLDTRFPEY